MKEPNTARIVQRRGSAATATLARSASRPYESAELLLARIQAEQPVSRSTGGRP